MIANIANTEIETTTKKLVNSNSKELDYKYKSFPYRGLVSAIAKDLGRKRNNVWVSIHINKNKDLINELETRAQSRLENLKKQRAN
jgi:hypothetical protein